MSWDSLEKEVLIQNSRILKPQEVYVQGHTQYSVHGSLKWWTCFWSLSRFQPVAKGQFSCLLITPVSLRGSVGGPLTSLSEVHKTTRCV